MKKYLREIMGFFRKILLHFDNIVESFRIVE